MARLYLDADVKPTFQLVLQMRWHDVVLTRDLNALEATDAEQLLIATRQERVLITHNGKDFRTLCQAWRVWRNEWNLQSEDHAAVIAIPQQSRLSYPEAAKLIDRLLESSATIWNGLWYFDVAVGDWLRQI